MIHAVILAGGVGSRFWPRSRKHKPKQMLNIFGKNSLIQETISRISSLAPPEQTLIVTTRDLVKSIHQQLPDLKADNFLVEPVGRNTAPCIGLAAMKLMEQDPEGYMVVLPADHLISDREPFIACLKQALDTARQDDSLVTIGIQPTHPETGYGYIQYHPGRRKPSGAYEVVTFAEKPNYATAVRFLASGDFLWNSGMFIWSVRRILAEIESSMPELYAALMEIQRLKGYEVEQFTNLYSGIRSISVDYGIMERASNVAVVKAAFSWTDIGNWAEVYRLSPKDDQGNVNLNGHVLVDARNCYIDSPDRLVALVGVQDLVVINTGDALLICHRDHAQDVKKAVEYMERHQMDKYL
ncbi:MAG: mannose-1-phosphate guanylyltransferase [Candidatus Zixiibacteriota bacterium]|nr:MAG: mannose-1-phosphate guanylyltransferase [candidate division Zixibacteria bacterium]